MSESSLLEAGAVAEAARPANATAPVSTAKGRGRGRAFVRVRVLAALVAAGLVALSFATLSIEHAIVSAIVSVALVALSTIDYERGIIPNRIVLPAAAVVLVAQIAFFPDQALEWTLAALIAGLAFLITNLVGRSWIGMGDVKLALLLGAALGWGVVGAVLLAFVCVLPVALVVLIRGGLAARKATIPFGPFLALGGLLVLFGPHLAGLAGS